MPLDSFDALSPHGPQHFSFPDIEGNDHIASAPLLTLTASGAQRTRSLPKPASWDSLNRKEKNREKTRAKYSANTQPLDTADTLFPRGLQQPLVPVGLQLEPFQHAAPAQLMTNTSTLTPVDPHFAHHQDVTPTQALTDASMRMLETYAEFAGSADPVPTASAQPSRRHATAALITCALFVIIGLLSN
jgi:hypothetical protein